MEEKSCQNNIAEKTCLNNRKDLSLCSKEIKTCLMPEKKHVLMAEKTCLNARKDMS